MSETRLIALTALVLVCLKRGQVLQSNISRRVAGTYRFLVHNPVDGLSTTSSRLFLSNAQVRVYVGSSTTSAIFNVPPARPGTLWTVFEMDEATGVITPVNSLTLVQDPAAVQ